jgi:hypothetical protein
MGGGDYICFILVNFHYRQETIWVVAEGQGSDWKCDGSNPEKVIEKVIFKIWLNFV